MWHRIMSWLVALQRERLMARADTCDRPGCQRGIHYHYGYGQRFTSSTPQTGPNDFSDGRPFYKE